MTRPAFRGWPLLLLLAGMALLAGRTWIGLDHPLPLGVLGDPLTLRANKLSGWLTAGLALRQWSWPAVGANLSWELLPALLFGAGLAGWCLAARPTVRWPRLAARWVAPLGFTWLLGVAAAISWFCFGGMPHVQDSIAQQFQAQIFAHGRAFAPAPAVADQLANEFVVHDQGRWYSQYPPMQPALLALGVVAGAPWLINPLAGALSVLFLFRAARTLYGTPTARVALALCCASPFLWFMSGERMNHTATLLFLSAALWGFAPALGRRRQALSPWRAGGSALCLGLAISSRSLCGAAVAMPMLVALLPCVRALRGGSLRSGTLMVVAMGLGLGILPLLAFNAATAGSPFRSGYEVLWGSSGWGFGASQWGPPHTLERGILHTVTNWDAAAKYLFEWPVPSLAPLLGLVFLKRRTQADRLLLATLLVLTAAYLPYFFQDLCLGPRFLYAGVPAFILLSARGLRGWGLYLARIRRVTPRGGISIAARAALGCGLVGLAVNVPLLLHWYGSGFWGTTDALTTQVSAQGVHHALVLIQDYNVARRVRLLQLGVSDRAAHAAVADLDERWIDEQVAATAGLAPAARAAELTRVLGETAADPRLGHRRTRVQWIDYQGPSTNANLGFYANTPWPERQDVIYAVDLGTANGELFRTYPNRSVWRYAFDATAGEFRLRPAAGQITSR